MLRRRREWGWGFPTWKHQARRRRGWVSNQSHPNVLLKWNWLYPRRVPSSILWLLLLFFFYELINTSKNFTATGLKCLFFFLKSTIDQQCTLQLQTWVCFFRESSGSLQQPDVWTRGDLLSSAAILLSVLIIILGFSLPACPCSPSGIVADEDTTCIAVELYFCQLSKVTKRIYLNANLRCSHFLFVLFQTSTSYCTFLLRYIYLHFSDSLLYHTDWNPECRLIPVWK